MNGSTMLFAPGQTRRRFFGGERIAFGHALAHRKIFEFGVDFGSLNGIAQTVMQIIGHTVE